VRSKKQITRKRVLAFRGHGFNAKNHRIFADDFSYWQRMLAKPGLNRHFSLH
jgi:hypothetical protein